MGGMIAQEVALLLLDRSRLASLGLAVTCRGLRPLGGLLTPLFHVRLLAPLLGWWYAYDTQRLVERLIGKLLTREVLAARHPATGQTLETVRGEHRAVAHGMCGCTSLSAAGHGHLQVYAGNSAVRAAQLSVSSTAGASPHDTGPA
jgi:hypothetical protein